MSRHDRKLYRFLTEEELDELDPADRDDYEEWVSKGREVFCWYTTELISSELHNGKHSPALDIDFEARLRPSSTPGHYHLLLEGLELSWKKYRKLLKALAKAGVIEPGYYRASVARKASFLRKPGVTK